MKKIVPVMLVLFSFTLPVYAGPVEFFKDSFDFSSKWHKRISFNAVHNTVDLKSSEGNDDANYLAYAYDIQFDLKHISGINLFVEVERTGRQDYNAPIMTDGNINALFGEYDEYDQEAIIPRIDEIWLDAPVPFSPLRIKGGLLNYRVGNEYALGGKYENYGISLYYPGKNLTWRLHYEREDYVNRIRLGPALEQERNNLDYEDTWANFYAADTTIKIEDHSVQLYLGYLQDKTKSMHRNNKFNVPTNEDNLVTAGADFKLNFGDLALNFEAARNFGKVVSRDSGNFPDIKHEGHMLIGQASYFMGIFKPRAKVLIASGNKIDSTDYNSGTFKTDNNKAFAVFSPSNANLTDSHYQKNFGPFLAMAGGYAVNFGVDRPGIYGDPFILENIILYNTGTDLFVSDKIYFGIDYWYLTAYESGVGLTNAGEIKDLHPELGHEIDLYASYNVTKNLSLNLLYGYFIPGQYYDEERSDTDPLGMVPNVRGGDGDASPAFQLEIGVEWRF